MLQTINKIFSDKPSSELDSEQLKEIKTKIIKAWKNLVNNKKATAESVIAYIIIRSFDGFDPAKELSAENFEIVKQNVIHHLRKAFTPITSKNKLSNGRVPYGTMLNAFSWMTYSNRTICQQMTQLDYEGLIDQANISKLRTSILEEFQNV